MLRPKAMRWTHDKREGETDMIKQLNFMFVQRLLDSEEFRAFRGTGNLSSSWQSSPTAAAAADGGDHGRSSSRQARWSSTT